MHHDLRRLLQIDAPFAQNGAAFPRDGFQQIFILHGRDIVRGHVELEARRDGRWIVRLQVGQQFERDLFVVEGIAADGAAGGQV